MNEQQSNAGGCVLCSASPHDGGGMFFDDDHWICQSCWGKAAEAFEKAGKVTTDNYFGGCPHCGNGEYVNVFKSHYNVCDTHKVFWPIGYNLFSSWQEENQEIWRKNDEMLKGFTQVEPIWPPDHQPVSAEECRRLVASSEIPF